MLLERAIDSTRADRHEVLRQLPQTSDPHGASIIYRSAPAFCCAKFSDKSTQLMITVKPASHTNSKINTNPKTFRKIRLSTTLVVPFVLQIITTVGLVGYLSFRNGQKAVQELATQLNTEITARVVQKLENHLSLPNQISQVNQVVLERNLLNLNQSLSAQQRQTLRRYLLELTRQNPGITSVWIMMETQREYADSQRLEDGSLVYHQYGQLTDYHLETRKTDRQGNLTERISYKPFAPRQRPWYIAAVKAGKPVWADIYSYVSDSKLVLALSQPLYNSSGDLLAIFGCDITLSALSQFLETLRVGQTGQVFVMERNGLLVGTSTGEVPFQTRQGAKKPTRLKAVDSQNQLTAATAKHLTAQFNNLAGIQTKLQTDFTFHHQRYFVTTLPFRDDKGLDWPIVVVVPESDFMAQIDANTQNTLWLCLATLGLAIVLGRFTAHRIARPIERIIQASEDMAQGDLQQHVKPSSIAELDKLSHSFNSMAGQLKESFEAMRQAEENYRGIFENALEGIFQSSPEGRLLSANPTMARIFGYDSPADVINSLTDLHKQVYVNPHDRDRFQMLIREQGQVKDFEFQVYRRDRSVIWVQMDARAVPNASGDILYYEGIMQDISDRKRQKEILEAMVKERTAELVTANAKIIALNEKLKVENLRMGAELNVVRQIQQMILPKPKELEIEGLDIAGFMEPADEVGGDYYDVLQTDGVVTIGMGDVTGHGLESGILMLMTQTAVRILTEIREYDPVQFLNTLNRTIYKNIQRMNSDKNLTLVILNYVDGKVSISGQHEETLIVRNGGHIERIDTIDLGFPIGLDEDIADFISHTTVELQPGDGIVLYTDGITEAQNIHKKQYGIERLCAAIGLNWHLSAPETKEAIIADLRQFIGKQKVFDDITLMVLKRQDNASEDRQNHLAAL